MSRLRYWVAVRLARPVAGDYNPGRYGRTPAGGWRYLREQVAPGEAAWHRQGGRTLHSGSGCWCRPSPLWATIACAVAIAGLVTGDRVTATVGGLMSAMTLAWAARWAYRHRHQMRRPS